MKRTELEKRLGLKIAGRQAGEKKTQRFGTGNKAGSQANQPQGLLAGLLKKADTSDNK
ncbi:hypothetical protein [Chitinimonas sp. BJYL2]|uniref:hypothetical protein n=1 Tax=Chitinimonas sp. BJYL2 TaxID=2976696 RepID=UPI0022B4DBE6|nr:hypothetical protein [Chitinimonas sp. BJYL2]